MKFKPIHLLHLILLSTIFWVLGCDILGLKTDEKCSGTLTSVKTTATLAGFVDSDYELATPTDGNSADSAILSSACPATFILTYGYKNLNVQYAKGGRPGQPIDPPYKNVPLTHYENAFHVNLETITFDATPGIYLYPRNSTSDTAWDFQIILKDHGDYPGSGSRGKFFIKTGLKDLVLNTDSTVLMTGEIKYYH